MRVRMYMYMYMYMYIYISIYLCICIMEMSKIPTSDWYLEGLGIPESMCCFRPLGPCSSLDGRLGTAPRRETSIFHQTFMDHPKHTHTYIYMYIYILYINTNMYRLEYK